MAVDRCVCNDVTFSWLAHLAAEGDATLESLTDQTSCGTGCGMCIPYIEAMLRTGMTSFRVLSPAQLAQLCGDGRAAPAADPIGSAQQPPGS
jgi:NAD(P)H-nitrite reductase large subunit